MGMGRTTWLLGLTICAATIEAAAANRYAGYPPVVNISEGIAWPTGQALPIFATPAAPLDTVVVQDLSKDEQIMVSSLQGLVNRKQPRILLLDARAGEGRDTWAETMGLETRPPADGYELVAKYAGEVAGVVLYDPAKSPHYRNLAGTVAGQKRALPVTPAILGRLKERGIDLITVADLSGLKFSTPLEIYGHLYEEYWPKCGKRMLVSANPEGDFHHTRDIAAAVGAAVVWLDNRIPAEREQMRKFFGDMKAGEAIVLGWYSTERSGITTASEFGIGTLPADHFMSGSVFAGVDHRIHIPAVPKKPKLDDKVHVAVFISDGDNIQYTQHAMRMFWDRAESIRGKVALNWTISPGLVDIAPGIMNYYYQTATPLDCFATGPSGLGYLMPFNTLKEPGAPVGEYTKDKAMMDAYSRLTETYLQRSGLRVMTIWDNASPMQRASYERHCRNLYGATVQNFRDVPSVEGSVENRRLRFDKLVVPYAGSYEHISGSMKREIRRWDGKSPAFLAYQVDIWGEMKPDRILELRNEMDREFPGKVSFVRADHYFNLYNEARGLPFNLVMDAETSVRSSDPNSHPEAAADGAPMTLWTSEANDPWLGFDFGEPRRISRCVVRHAGDDANTRDFTIRTSSDGSSWKTLAAVRGNAAYVTDVEISPVSARYLKLVIADGTTARIADVEVFGSR
jgi:hypothetical protein